MSNPSVTATISVDDKASPALKELATLARKIAQDTANALKPGSGDAYAAQFSKANVAARGHLSALTSIRNMHREIAAIVGGVAAGAAAHKAREQVAEYGKYEKDVRYQTAVGGFSSQQQRLLADQRNDAAQRLGVKPEDALHAQNAFVTRNFSAEITKAATDQALTLSKALNIPAERAAKIVEGMVFGQGIHLHDPAQAAKEMQAAGDRATVMAKRGAMTDEDIVQNSKYSSSMATAANVSANQNAAIAMTLKRANVGGDESGVFQRQLYARAMAPTKLGYDAMAAAGINYDSYSKHGAVSPEAIDASLMRRFGKGLNEAGRNVLRERIDDPEGKALSSREEFGKAVHDAVEASGQKMSKTDEKHVNDAGMRQYDLAKQGLNGAALVDAIINKMSGQQLMGFLGDKQGGRGQLLLNGKEQYGTYKDELDKSEGLAGKIAEERMKGLGFALDNFGTALTNASLRLVEVVQGPLESVAKFGTKIVNVLDSIPDGAKIGAAVGGVLGMGAAALASVAGVISLGSSALAAAASLNLLATRGVPGLAPVVPAGGGVKGAVPPGAAPAAAAVASAGSRVAGVLGGVATGLGWAAVVAAVTPMVYAATSDKAQGVDRDGTRSRVARDAIRQDADDRMLRAIEANDQQARKAAVVAAGAPSVFAPSNGNVSDVDRDGTRSRVARDAIRQDADDRMLRAIEANDQQARKAAVLAAAAPSAFAPINGNVSGVDRDGTRPRVSLDAIRQDADDRMKREIEATDRQAREAAERGNAKIDAVTKPYANGPLRPSLRDQDGSVFDRGASPIANLTGTMTGDANVTVTVNVNPSALLTSIVDQAKSMGSMNITGKIGTGFQGDGNATRSSQPARTYPSGGSH
ncbi:hypothetical protein V1281_002639 [Nitrobacteraceae bacterium AZCC 2161]